MITIGFEEIDNFIADVWQLLVSALDLTTGFSTPKSLLLT